MDSDLLTDILPLYNALQLQAQNLLRELSVSTTYISDHPLTPRLDLLHKFHTDVIRESDLLTRHGTLLNLPLPSTMQSGPQTPSLSESTTSLPTEGTPLKSSTASPTPVSSTLHAIRSSNIPFHTTLWHALKQCTGVTAIRKPVRYTVPEPITPGHICSKDTNKTRSINTRSNRKARDRAAAKTSQPHSTVGRSTNILDTLDISNRTSTQSSNISTATVIPNDKIHSADSITATSHSPIDLPSNQKIKHGKKSKPNKEPVMIDIITDHGQTWIKLFTKSFDWLVLDMAREGIVFSDVHDMETNGNHFEDDKSNNPSSIDDEDVDVEALESLKLVKVARDICAARRMLRAGEGRRHPQIEVWLTRIGRGQMHAAGRGDVRFVLGYLEERVGVKVLLADEVDMGREHKRKEMLREEHAEETQTDKVLLEGMIARMVSLPPAVSVTETLNIDCTILIALISDISHFRSEDARIPEHYQGRPALIDIKSQLATEPDDPLLPNQIYPVLRGKKLVCTATAAAHLRNIVQVMGSSGETKRSRIFLPVGPDDNRGREELRTELEKLTVHTIPADLQLPIEVVEDAGFDRNGLVRALEQDVMSLISNHPRLSPLNRSVFFHGWAKRMTTVSLNRVVSDWLDRTIDSTLNEIESEGGVDDVAAEEDFCGPKHLICGRERSLLGSEKCSHTSGRICKGQCHHR